MAIFVSNVDFIKYPFPIFLPYPQRRKDYREILGSTFKNSQYMDRYEYITFKKKEYLNLFMILVSNHVQ